MQENGSSTSIVSDDSVTSAFEFAKQLPFEMIKSEVIPPVPNRSPSAIDWLLEFAGCSWIAYGASSLLVVSHFPNPLSNDEILLGPIFRQTFELSIDGAGSVTAVSWSPATPSVGDLAAALDNCIGLFSFSSDACKGSFCWRQTEILLQSAKVEAISWTGSGDGIISAGSEIVLWWRNGKSWGMAWKFRPELCQGLVSATWSVDGPFATASLCQQHTEALFSGSKARKGVSVFHCDGKFNYLRAELYHPLPVSMIQWRPINSKHSKREAENMVRQVLLTCCMDGTVRLWSETGDGRSKKIGKGGDRNSMKLPFHVVAVIEVNQELNGTLGVDTFVKWATDVDGTMGAGMVANDYFSGDDSQHDMFGRCEWLIGFGPQMLITLWAIHYLDEFNPVRFPRVTLWKTIGAGLEVGGLPLEKVAMLRNGVLGPPTICSLICLLPCNSLAWSQLYNQTSYQPDGSMTAMKKEDFFSRFAGAVLDVDGHTGKISRVAVHHFGFEAAVSLDADGSLLFWAFSTFSNSIVGLPTLSPALKLTGKLLLQDSYSRYTTMCWAPTVIEKHLVLLVGYTGGIDCLLIKFYQDEDHISCHKLCTISFLSHSHEEGPTSIFSVPLPSTCRATYSSNAFMVLALWKNAFRAVSWKITFHSSDLSGGFCGCGFDVRDSSEDSKRAFKSTFGGMKHCIVLNPFSSVLPDPHNDDQVTSFAVVCPTYIVSTGEESISIDDTCHGSSAYQMVTGHANGSLKLWRSMPAEQSKSASYWELVGMLAACQRPVLEVSLTGCGQKIAVTCHDENSDTSSTLHIWESIKITGTGAFMLEDTVFLDGKVIGLNWLTTGSGEPLLGVCLENQLQIYARRRCGGHNLLKSRKSLEKNIWICIAFAHSYSTMRDFFWGPRATALAVHDNYFSLFSDLLCPTSNRSGESDILTAISADSDSLYCKYLSMEANNNKCLHNPSIKMKMTNDLPSCIPTAIPEEKQHSVKQIAFWRIAEVLEKLCGSLPLYHPEALLANICSGKLMRAYVAIKHLAECLQSKRESPGGCSEGSGPFISSVHLLNYLEGQISTDIGSKAFQLSVSASVATPFHLGEDLPHYANRWESDGSNSTSTSSSLRSEFSGIIDILKRCSDISGTSKDEKMQILAIIDLLQEICNPDISSAYKGLDEAGQRFWVAVKFQRLYSVQRYGKVPSPRQLVDSVLVGWAFHSDCQEALFNSLLPSEPSWQEMRALGVGFWYTNEAQLRIKIERLAKLQYLKNRDPKACALFYIALNRLQVLAGLFRISKDEKDKLLVKFLSRNFQEEKNKEAALKNAYVLLGRHQLELAISFFLLGGDISSAVTVCTKNLGDEQLALVICRLVEGYGGPSERYLVSKLLLPSAVGKGDHCFASYLEWVLGNYMQSFLRLMDIKMDSLASDSAVLSNHVSFLDPSIGYYCLMLARKNSMKNAIGECTAAVLGGWATLMVVTALHRCGLPLEALEYSSSSLGHFRWSDHGSMPNIPSNEFLSKMLVPFPDKFSLNWISSDVASHLELHAKLDSAMCYFSKIVREHPCWLQRNVSCPGSCSHSAHVIDMDKMSVEQFQQKLFMEIACFEQKFSLVASSLINMIVIFLRNNSLPCIAQNVLQCYASKLDLIQKSHTFGKSFSQHIMPKLFLKAIEETPWLLLRYIAASSIISSQLKPCSTESSMDDDNIFATSVAWKFYVLGLQWCLHSSRAALELFSVSYSENFIRTHSILFDLIEYCVYFASSLLQSNFDAVVAIMKPLLITTNGHTPYEINTTDVRKLLSEIAGLCTSSSDPKYATWISKLSSNLQGNEMISLVPDEEKWQIIVASLWGNISAFLQHQLNSLPANMEASYPFFQSNLYTFASNSRSSETDGNSSCIQMRLSASFNNLIKTMSLYIFSLHAKQLALFLWLRLESLVGASNLSWLEDLIQSQSRAAHKSNNQFGDGRNMVTDKSRLSASQMLLYSFVDSKIMNQHFAEESLKWFWYIKRKHLIGWNDVYSSIMQEQETDSSAHDQRHGSNSGREETSSHGTSLSYWTKKGTQTKKVVPFTTTREIYKRSGELLEALCVNSINHHQAAVASNRKGIIFFNWEGYLAHEDKSNDIWEDVDWPPNGWEGSVSAPITSSVSPGIGFQTKKGSHVVLGGASVGVSSLARPGRDLTGGGAFGVPRYAGVGAVGLGWGAQDKIEEFAHPPASIENIGARGFSSHPNRPFFLVGSSNSYTYLWKFGQQNAIAIYGVLPPANAATSASISAVRFDQCGNRFATAALDGTLCTWQLEVGGRSNVCPTESSLCFNNHASDATYITASGSIIAAAGYSSSGVNVVIWDTLAPPATSRASIICHEGGARSLSVFDNNIGSGSISPVIVTGGRGGDIALHDFRYIATGKTKKHKSFDSSEQTNPSTTAMKGKIGEPNANGMLWYIPKAHSGSISKISTIPNTSFFLTGSKDGDVKLWDAKRAELVFRWPKLHERHTFLQSSSHGFGAVIRAAVTDIQVAPRGFFTCGGDGSVMFVHLKDSILGYANG